MTVEDEIKGQAAELLLGPAHAAVDFYDKILARPVISHRMRLDAEQAALMARAHLQALLVLLERPGG